MGERDSTTSLIDGALYRSISGQWLTGVTVVSARTREGRPVGLTMNAISPLSLSPPQFLASIDLGSETLAAIIETGAFCINFLAADQANVCKTFASKAVDKFTGVHHRPGTLAVPVIAGTIAHVECSVAAIHTSGDHAIVIGNAYGGHARGGEPLVYFTSAFRGLAPCS